MIDAMAPNATMLGYEERNIMFDTVNLCAQCKLMAFFKKTNCPVFFTTIRTPPLGRACLLNLLPSTTIAYLLDAWPGSIAAFQAQQLLALQKSTTTLIINQVIEDMNLTDNAEQEHAVCMVAEHFISCMSLDPGNVQPVNTD